MDYGRVRSCEERAGAPQSNREHDRTRERYYDTYLQRFLQPDSIMPDWYSPQNLNRYSYVRNNPLRYTDPTGHMELCDDETCGIAGSGDPSTGTNPSSGNTPAQTNGNQGPAQPGSGNGGQGNNVCSATLCYNAPPSPTIGPSNYNPLTWSYWCLAVFCNRSGTVLVGGNLSTKIPLDVLPPWVGTGLNGGLEWAENQAGLTEGIFGYFGQSATVGASANANVYIGGTFNYSNQGASAGSQGQSYSGRATSYQANVSVGWVGISVSDTVVYTNGSANPPFAPNVPQTITIGWAPGFGIGASASTINEFLMLGRDISR